MNYILLDSKRDYENLLPLTYTRPVSLIRVGIMTIKEKWEKILNTECSFITQDYLQKKFPTITEDENIIINSSILPDEKLTEAIQNLGMFSFLITRDNIFIAAKLDKESIKNIKNINFLDLQRIDYLTNINKISYPWDIFKLNGQEIERDFKAIVKNRQSHPISPTNTVFNEQNIFIEEGAEVECSVLNAKNGYIYIGKNAQVMENTVIRGSLALCENSVLKIGAKIYGPTTIGPHSKVGGEVNNSVIIGYSNKAHDGFLGNSVIGEWCNLGADTNNSNLKNNYAEVKLWNYRSEKFVKTGLQFCGLIMGDHSKSGINTMFNTGTVVGVSSNIFGTGFPRNFIPSFSWGGAHGFAEYKLNKALETAKIVMKRRNIELSEEDTEILQYIFDVSQKYRN